MHVNPKFIAGGAGLFGLGALFGWAVTGDYHERRTNEIEDDYIRVIRNMEDKLYLLENQAFAVKPDEIVVETEVNDQVILPEDEEEDEGPEPTEEEIEESRTNLQRIIDQYTADPESSSMVEQGVAMEVDKTPPFVISANEYSWSEEGDDYEKTTLTYYPRHRVLLDEDEDPVDDIATTVGWRNLAQFGGESGDPNVVFVRNRRLEVDFEIVKEEENDLPLHVKYGMPKDQFNANRAAGLIRFRPEDM